MPLFVHQFDLFDDSGHRQLIANGEDFHKDVQTLPTQSAASSAFVIDELLKSVETLAGLLNDDLLLRIYRTAEEANQSYHAEVVDHATYLSLALRMHWPGLRYQHLP